MRFDHDGAGKTARVREPAETWTLPGEYLLLRVGRASAFAERYVTYDVAGGRYELRFGRAAAPNAPTSRRAG
jgi:hypothetical protein